MQGNKHACLKLFNTPANSKTREREKSIDDDYDNDDDDDDDVKALLQKEEDKP